MKSKGKSSIYRRGSLHCRTNFQDMTMTRWRERGLGVHWLKMAANYLIGRVDFRRQISVGRGAGWREINVALSGGFEFCRKIVFGASRFRSFDTFKAGRLIFFIYPVCLLRMNLFLRQ